MAKKNKIIELENYELKPQVIGHVFQKKNNIGRVIFIFIAFLLVIYYINDISVFINNLLGRNTAETIKNPNKGNTDNKNENPNVEGNEIVYNVMSASLVINVEGLVLNNFKNINNVLTFDVSNDTNANINLSNRKYYLETYTENKTLLERFKVDFNSINASAKMSFSFNILKDFNYIVLVEKTTNDYPVLELPISNETGYGTITCRKGIETLVYNFTSEGLKEIRHTISDSNTDSDNYSASYIAYQNKTNNYNNIPGITATFNGSSNGYTAIITVDLANTNLANLNEKYYYGYKEEAKVVSFEMKIYGFNCS